MTDISKNQRAVLVAVTVVVTMLAVRALFGDVFAGFMDGVYIGFTDAR